MKFSKPIRDEFVPVAGFVHGRMKLTCPAGMRLQDYAGELLRLGWKLHQVNPRQRLREFRTSVTPVKVSIGVRNLCIETKPDRAENMAQWCSHLMSLALDHQKVK